MQPVLESTCNEKSQCCVQPPHITLVQCCGGCSVHRGDNTSTVGDSFSTVEVAPYSGGCFSTVGDSFSTVEVVQYMWGITSVHVGDNISTCGG